MKKILILNGSPRKKGNTVQLIKSFIKGAKERNHQIKTFNLYDMNISGCKGCLRANENSSSPCTQKDDMNRIYKEFESADIIVFASPLYFWTISGPLKTAVDRLYAELECLGYSKFAKDSILLMTSDSHNFDLAENWYKNFERNLGWRNIGLVLGKGKLKEAYELGKNL